MASGGPRQCIRDSTFYLILLIAISTLGPLQFGFHLAELNAPQDVITCKKKGISTTDQSVPLARNPNLPQCIPMDDAQFAIISSIFTLGGLAGALAAGPVSTKYGRLVVMRITSLAFLVGGLFEALAGSIPIISVGRFLSGVGAGASTVVVPLYISEVAPPRQKGLFGAFTQITTNIGILLAQTLGFFLSRGSMWRIVLAVGSGLGLVQGLGLFFIPESPVWTATHKDPQNAVSTLQRIRGRGHNIDEEIKGWNVDTRDIRAPEEEGLLRQPSPPPRRLSSTSKGSTKSTSAVGFLEIARNSHYRPALIAVIGIMFAQQLCGINSIIMYSVSLLSTILPTSAALITILISVVNLVATTLCAPLADKLGRKASILISIAGMGTMSLCLAFSILFSIKVLSGLSALLFVASFAVGLGPVPFILASELVDSEAAGALQSWSLGANWIATFVVAQFFPIVNAWLGGRGKVYFIFAALALFWGCFIAWWVPETKGKKDADEVWGRVRRDD